jgi:hypothetical protein
MKMYDPVTLVCGEDSGAAETMRASLESMWLWVQGKSAV